MLKSVILSALVLTAVSAHAEEEKSVWRTARVLKVDVMESLPPQYDVTYVARCNDLEARVIQFQAGSDTVVGVAVKRGPLSQCTEGEKPFEKKNIKAVGSMTDTGSVKVLR